MVVAYLRRGEYVGPSLCPTMANPDLVLQEKAQARHIHASTMSRPGIYCIKMQSLVYYEYLLLDQIILVKTMK